ncbi:MAG: CocE/NonD family hydrolase, partial [Actinobacteria bacterium]|nr:CocE/NonD family hydrolase [Actinomycetota bacterium]
MRPTKFRALLIIAAMVSGALALAPAHAAGRITETGYITLPDQVTLKYTAVFPDDGAAHPTLFEYSGYNPGSIPDQAYINEYVPEGYAFIGVNIRGTGCSGGTLDFFEPQEARDGAFVIDNFLQTRTWSNGDVAMIGKSYPGITQLFVAEEQPTHLKAIAPGHFYGDIYRDVAFPGGIFNYAFAGLWSFIAQPSPGYQSAASAIAAGDKTCAANVAQHTATNAQYNAFIQAQQHPYDDALTQERSPETLVDNIAVPLFTAVAWQDEQVGPREAEMIAKLRCPHWAILTNGDHGMYRTATSLAMLHEFFDHFLKGVENRFSASDPNRYQPITYWWEAGRDSARAPGWTTSGKEFPPTASALRLFLASGSKLAPASEETSSADVYAYPGGSQSIANPYYASTSLPNQYMWANKPAPGMAVSYTSEPFAQNT